MRSVGSMLEEGSGRERPVHEKHDALGRVSRTCAPRARRREERRVPSIRASSMASPSHASLRTMGARIAGGGGRARCARVHGRQTVIGPPHDSDGSLSLAAERCRAFSARPNTPWPPMMVAASNSALAWSSDGGHRRAGRTRWSTAGAQSGERPRSRSSNTASRRGVPPVTMTGTERARVLP